MLITCSSKITSSHVTSFTTMMKSNKAFRNNKLWFFSFSSSDRFLLVWSLISSRSRSAHLEFQIQRKIDLGFPVLINLIDLLQIKHDDMTFTLLGERLDGQSIYSFVALWLIELAMALLSVHKWWRWVSCVYLIILWQMKALSISLGISHGPIWAYITM